MQASQIMTKAVLTVPPETPVREIARLLLEHAVSAVVVVDPSGAAIGMVSEGDLIGRNDAGREARRDWWLALIAEGEALHPDFLATMHSPGRTARDIMSAPVVTVGDTTPVREIAKLLADYHIKRVPVARDGKVVGIVSRADLLRAFVSDDAAAAQPKQQSSFHGMIDGALTKLDVQFRQGDREADAEGAAAKAAPAEIGPTVADFKRLVADFGQRKDQRHHDAGLAVAAQRRQAVATLIDQHIPDERWKSILHDARMAAEMGDREFLLLRFPCDLCGDGGRAINAPLPEWPKTLRGEAAEIYLRWERDLKPRGFHLTARVLDFPGGKPGDIGLFLDWRA
jgi:CBS domain-containing protein